MGEFSPHLKRGKGSLRGPPLGGHGGGAAILQGACSSVGAPLGGQVEAGEGSSEGKEPCAGPLDRGWEFVPPVSAPVSQPVPPGGTGLPGDRPVSQAEGQRALFQTGLCSDPTFASLL